MIDYSRVSEKGWELLLSDWNPPVPRKVIKVRCGLQKDSPDREDRKAYIIEQLTLGLTMQQIAVDLGLSVSAISRIVAGKRGQAS